MRYQQGLRLLVVIASASFVSCGECDVSEASIYGCWERDGSAGREVVCFGRAHLPQSVVADLGARGRTGDFVYARWAGAPGSESLLASGEYEVRPDGDDIHLVLFEAPGPGRSLCSELDCDLDDGLKTGAGWQQNEGDVCDPSDGPSSVWKTIAGAPGR